MRVSHTSAMTLAGVSCDATFLLSLLPSTASNRFLGTEVRFRGVPHPRVMTALEIGGAHRRSRAPRSQRHPGLPNPDRYLLWSFALLSLIPESVEGYFMNVAPAFVGVLFLIVPLLNNKGGRAPACRTAAVCLNADAWHSMRQNSRPRG